MLLQTDLTNARVVPDHLLDIPKLPGGTLGDYQAHGKKYQLFIIETASNQDAALLLLEMKNVLASPEYISYMGGYYGKEAAGPIYAFAKLQYLAGVVGLAQHDADPIARQLAARLR